MLQISDTLAAKLSAGVTTLCHVWHVQRRDGEVFAFTDHDRPLAVEGAVVAEHAAEVDEGRYVVLFVSIAGVLASLTAIILELQAKLEPGTTKNAHVAFVFATVALSWEFVHTSFAKHYAHEFYGPATSGGLRKGLVFPAREDPDFADFFHFAIVIGVASQTADIQISAKPIRRIVTLHGVLAFLFNTVILALTINLAAGLFD